MKKIVISVLLLFAITACSNAKLVEQAETHFNNAEYNAALDAYAKALDKKEDAATRNAYTALKTEVDRIHVVNKLRKDLKLAVSSYESTLSPRDLLDMCDRVTEVTAQIDAFDTTVKDSVSTYVNKLRESFGYTMSSARIGLIRVNLAIGSTDVPWVTDATKLNEYADSALTDPPLPYGYADVN